MRSMNLMQVRKVLEHFKFAPRVSNMALRQYCERMKFEDVLGEGDYMDNLFQFQHDQRVIAILPKLFTLVATYQYPQDYISDKAKAEIKEHNGDIEWKIAKLLEDEGIVYKEIDIITENLGDTIKGILTSGGNRLNNMCTTVLADLGRKKFGEALVVSDMAVYYREIAQELGQNIHPDFAATEEAVETVKDVVD